ncbi:MAG TPA: universal stress protein [Roseiflexaceae bacterium]|nr:universal stress protein [Roseiflexaceae bacterium]HMP39160.1 universal stress protein [Roseiflexaceae bacterium]
MPQINGPILFITNGQPAIRAAIPQLQAYADAFGCQLRLIVQVPRATQDVLLPKYAVQIRTALPEALQSTPIDVLRPAQLRPLLRAAAANGGGMVAVLPTRNSGLKRILQPNHHERLLLDGPLPLLALGRQARESIRRILFPVDLAPRSEALLDDTIALCRRLGAELHLLHVYGDDRLLPAEIDTGRRAAARTPRELYEIDKQQLAALAARAEAADIAVTAGYAEGRAHTQIAAYTANHAIDLIVMATHGPRSTADILFGTTTARVINRVSVPVLAAFT